jgi:hypothetical protein
MDRRRAKRFETLGANGECEGAARSALAVQAAGVGRLGHGRSGGRGPGRPAGGDIAGEMRRGG